MRVFVGAEESPITLVLDKRHRSYNLPTGKTKPIVQAWILSHKLNHQRFVFFSLTKKVKQSHFQTRKLTQEMLPITSTSLSTWNDNISKMR